MELVTEEFTIDKIFPWGRSLDEYRAMFALNDADLDKRILGCADGPASFNAEMHRRGKSVVSCDPLFEFGAEAIRSRIAKTSEKMLKNARENYHRFTWSRIKSPEEMVEVRLAAMEIFLQDYEIGRAAGRYMNEPMPTLPFHDDQFDLALSSHFLFLYSDELSLDFHLEAIMEMCRVAPEARIFPILSMNAQRSRYVEPVRQTLSDAGFSVVIEIVDYEFQRGGNQMMRIQRGRK